MNPPNTITITVDSLILASITIIRYYRGNIYLKSLVYVKETEFENVWNKLSHFKHIKKNKAIFYKLSVLT